MVKNIGSFCAYWASGGVAPGTVAFEQQQVP